MDLVKRGWTYLTYGLTAYTIYKHLQSLNSAKDDLYLSLAPEQRAEWDKIFGKPSTVLLNPAPKLTAPVIAHIQAGT